MRRRGLSLLIALGWAVLVSSAIPGSGFAESENSRSVKRVAPAERAGSARAHRTTTPSSQNDDDALVLVLTGVIQPGAYRQFRSAIRSREPSLVVLDSPGGVLGEALLIGDEVRRRGLNTLVGPNDSCASACAVVFLSGRTKFMGPGAAVGLHSAFSLDGKVDKEATSIMASYLSGVGVPRSILRRMAATGPTQMRWLTRAEQKALRIKPME